MVLQGKYRVLLKQGIFGFSVFAFLLFVPFIVNAETIDGYQTTLSLEKTGVIHVTEAIRYNFEDAQKHGIYRDIPLSSDKGPRIRIDDIAVVDEAQNSYRFTKEYPESDMVRIKIGDPDTLITGTHVYAISYDVSNVVRHFDDHDELYWNAVGTKWSIPIATPSAKIVLPEEINVTGEGDVHCFVGAQGSTTKDCTIKIVNPHEISVLSTRSLGDHEGMTVAVSLPTGVITGLATKENEPPTQGRSAGIAPFFGVALFLVFFLLILFFIAKNQGMRVPKELKHEPVVVAYEPPEGITPLDVGVIIDRKLDPSDVPSVIIDLAVHGYLKIRYVTNKGFWGATSKDYEFVKLKEGDDLAHPGYRMVWSMLFGEKNAAQPVKIGWISLSGSGAVAPRDSVTMSEIEGSQQTAVSYFSKIDWACGQYLLERGIMKRSNIIKVGRREGGVLLALVAGIFISGFIDVRIYGIPIFVIFFLLLAGYLIFRGAGEKLSESGIDAFRKIRGFKEFLTLVEADKLRLLNAPAVEPEMFEKFLPYAMVLGVADAWAQRFEGMTMQQPSWVDTGAMGWGMGFTPAAFAGSLSDMGSHFSSAFSPSSGGSGGGSSGGGSGGGGGGSW